MTTNCQVCGRDIRNANKNRKYCNPCQIKIRKIATKKFYQDHKGEPKKPTVTKVTSMDFVTEEVRALNEKCYGIKGVSFGEFGKHARNMGV